MLVFVKTTLLPYLSIVKEFKSLNVGFINCLDANNSSILPDCKPKKSFLKIPIIFILLDLRSLHFAILQNKPFKIVIF